MKLVPSGPCSVGGAGEGADVAGDPACPTRPALMVEPQPASNAAAAKAPIVASRIEVAFPIVMGILQLAATLLFVYPGPLRIQDRNDEFAAARLRLAAECLTPEFG